MKTTTSSICELCKEDIEEGEEYWVDDIRVCFRCYEDAEQGEINGR